MPKKTLKAITLFLCLLVSTFLTFFCQRVDLALDNTPAPNITPTPTPTLTPTPTILPSIKIKLGADGFRTWDDGSYACNCREYKNPVKAGYVFEGAAESGLYKIQPTGVVTTINVYCDMVNEGGGWTLALLNSSYGTSPAPNWAAAITGNTVMGDMKNGIVSGFDQLLGLDHWDKLGTTLRVEVGNDPLTISHRVIYDFSMDKILHYTIQLSNQRIRIGTTVPGLYTAHNNRPFTTYDSDNDTYSSTNCSASYSNAAWWYTSCWDGSFWGGGTGGNGHQNKPYWTSSGSDYYNWGAFWIK